MSILYARERIVGIKAVKLASKLCASVFHKLVEQQKGSKAGSTQTQTTNASNQETIIKSDLSPVTIADFGAQAIVNGILHKEFPADPIIGEEDSKDLQENEGLCEKVLALTNSVLSSTKDEKSLSKQQLLDAIDLGNYAGGPKGRFWTLDPIDGTKGFLRGEQYAVCLALVVDGIVQVAIQGCPNLPRNLIGDSLDGGSDKKAVARGSLFIAVRGEGAFERYLSVDLDGEDKEEDEVEKRIGVSKEKKASETSFCESVEAGHSSQNNSMEIAKLLGITRPAIRMDSQCKYACIARGDAGIYLRIPVNPKYEEKIWDHCGGSLLIEESGGKVCDVEGKKLDFSLGRTLKGNKGIIATNSAIHDEVVDAVKKVLG